MHYPRAPGAAYHARLLSVCVQGYSVSVCKVTYRSVCVQGYLVSVCPESGAMLQAKRRPQNLSPSSGISQEYISAEELLEGANWPGPLAKFDDAAEVMQDAGAYADEGGIYIKLGGGDASTGGGESSCRTKRTYGMLKLDYGTGPSSSEVAPPSGAPGKGPPNLYMCVVHERRNRTWDWVNPDQPVMETLTRSNLAPE